jgi:hypothetical protein
LIVLILDICNDSQHISTSTARGSRSSDSARLILANANQFNNNSSKGARTPRPLEGVIPRAAYGPLLNVTLDQTVGSGYLVVFPSPQDSEPPPPISNINWYGANQIIANLVVTKMAGEADVMIHAGGSGSTHVIVDVLGYFV